MIDRDDLDAFFARADDVLADWQPSDDAMIAHLRETVAFDMFSDLGYGENWLLKKPDEPASRPWWAVLAAPFRLLAHRSAWRLHRSTFSGR